MFFNVDGFDECKDVCAKLPSILGMHTRMGIFNEENYIIFTTVYKQTHVHTIEAIDNNINKSKEIHCRRTQNVKRI